MLYTFLVSKISDFVSKSLLPDQGQINDTFNNEKSDINYSYIKSFFISGSVLLFGAGLYCMSMPLCVLGTLCFIFALLQDINFDVEPSAEPDFPPGSGF